MYSAWLLSHLQRDIVAHVEERPATEDGILLFHLKFYADELLQTGYLALPKSFLHSPQKHPGFLYLRGGMRKAGMVKMTWLERFARQGQIVFAPTYRGNEGTEGREDFGLHDRRDAFGAFDLLATCSLVSTDKITIYGFSRGGPLAIFTAIEKPSARSVISHGGVADLALTYHDRPDLQKMLRRIIGGPPETHPRGYRMRSPIEVIDQLRVPLLIVQGLCDVQVDAHHATLLKTRAEAAGIPCDLLLLKDVGHHMADEPWENLARTMFTWSMTHVLSLQQDSL